MRKLIGSRCTKWIAGMLAVVLAVFLVPSAGVHAAGAAGKSAASETKIVPAAETVAPVSADYLSDAATLRGLTAKYAGKTVSITGDSISSFYGYIPKDYGFNYPQKGLDNVNHTWWMQVINACGMKLLRNASGVNAHASGDSTDTTGIIATSNRRMVDLFGPGATRPDVIFVMIGTNDFNQSWPLGSFRAGMPLYEGNQPTFAEGYNLMLAKLRAIFPDSEIICFTCIPLTEKDLVTKHVNNLGLTIDDYNAMIRTIASAYGCEVVETALCGLSEANAQLFTLDGCHPNVFGATLMAQYTIGTMY